MFNVPNDLEMMQEQIKLTGFDKPQSQREWVMHFRLFDLNVPDDVDFLEELYTKMANSRGKSGTVMLAQEGAFMEQAGTYKLMVRWGDWHERNTTAVNTESSDPR